MSVSVRFQFLKFLNLIRVATGEAWQEIMMATTAGKACQSPDGGVNVNKGLVCGTNVSYMYFVSFVFLATFLVSICFHYVNMSP